jgi:hypothetical protein
MEIVARIRWLDGFGAGRLDWRGGRVDGGNPAHAPHTVGDDGFRFHVGKLVDRNRWGGESRRSIAPDGNVAR